MVTSGPDKYCLRGTKWTNCFRRVGFTENNQTIENVEESEQFQEAVLSWNGDL